MQTQDVIDLGLVPEEVLLLAGRPGGAPSAFWTPRLAALPAQEQQELVERARDGLLADGLLDRDGMPRGPFADVARVVRGARVVLTFATRLADGEPTRGALLSMPDEVLLLVQVPDDGGQLATRATPAAAVLALAAGLDPLGFAPRSARRSPLRAAPTRMTAAELAELLPERRRRTTVLLARVALGEDDAPPDEQLHTVLGGRDGVHVVRALPDGDVLVAPLDDAGLLTLAAALLDAGGPAREVAA